MRKFNPNKEERSSILYNVESKRGRQKIKEEIHPPISELLMKLWKLRSGYASFVSKEQKTEDTGLRDPTRRVRNKQLLFKESQVSRETDSVGRGNLYVVKGITSCDSFLI